MTRAEIIMKLMDKNPHLSQKDIEKVVITIFSAIKGTLEKNGRVEIRGLGVFEVRERKARKLYNPLTKKMDMIPGKKVPFFKMSKKLKEKLNA